MKQEIIKLNEEKEVELFQYQQCLNLSSGLEKKLSSAEKEIKDVGVDAARCTRIDVELVASIEDLEKNIYSLLQQKSQLVDERDYLLIELQSADERFERLAERNKVFEKAVMEELVMQENRTQAIEKELQNRTQALEKAVMEMEELQENFNAHSQLEAQLEAALTKIDELKSENSILEHTNIAKDSDIELLNQRVNILASEKQRRSESKRRVTLRDYLYGMSETSQSRRKKVRFCACIRPSTRD